MCVCVCARAADNKQAGTGRPELRAAGSDEELLVLSFGLECDLFCFMPPNKR